MLVTPGIKREEEPPHHPIPRRAVLEIARKETQAIGTVSPPEGKHAFYMVLDTNWGSANYCGITQKNTLLVI